MLMVSAASIAAVNATLEELLWHGVPVVVFGDNPIAAWLWPALGFTAWHLGPKSVRTPEQPGMFLLGMTRGQVELLPSFDGPRGDLELNLTAPAHFAVSN